MFYEKFIRLCDDRGVSPTAACIAMGISDAITEAENTPRPVNTEEIKTVLSAYEGLSRAGKKAFWSRVLTKIVPIPDTGEFLLLYTNGNITDDILPFVHNRLS